MEGEEETELRNPFPSPPSHYTKYTTHNLNLLELLRERVGDADLSTVNQYEVLMDHTDVPEWSLVQLEKPRVDWILEEGHYTVFGDTWFVKETIPSLAELGGHQLYPADPSVEHHGRGNDLRPVQARGNLELMMRRQLELRREETKAIHDKCDELEAKLSAMRGTVQKVSKANTSTREDKRPESSKAALSTEDVLCWAEEIA
ncbi:hypothetical protein EVJ58_g5897 [Rhodofomes roseus]|uniref:Mediator of RNA polymerase II transcription subunit 7 n=1 Tax=Rhodofomes roseus TaxID=34475 RepID=A0A4Y9YBY0_9APHY|nr:hypothetical protein EVJ58_g5897 [Rhodofomes roseus]